MIWSPMRTVPTALCDPAFAPNDIDAMAKAFDLVLMNLGDVGRNERAPPIVANLIIREAKKGERDAHRLCRMVLQHFGKGIGREARHRP